MTTPLETQQLFHDNDPLREAFKGSSDPERLWLMRAMSLTREKCRTSATNEAVRQIREAAARTVGIPEDTLGYSYLNATPEQSADITNLTSDKITALEKDDPKAQAARELYTYLSGGIDSIQGNDYDIVIRLTEWARGVEDKGMSEEDVNYYIESGFMGLYDIYCLGKGILDD